MGMEGSGGGPSGPRCILRGRRRGVGRGGGELVRCRGCCGGCGVVVCLERVRVVVLVLLVRMWCCCCRDLRGPDGYTSVSLH